MHHEALEKTIPIITPHSKERGTIRTYIEFAIAWLILKSIGLLPRLLAVRLGKFISDLVRLTLPHLQKHALANLHLAFPDISDDERKRIVRGAFHNLGRLLGEISQFPRLNTRNISQVVVYEGLENYLHAVATGRGVILLTGHIGAWELSVFAHSIYGHPMSFLKRPTDNPLVERLAESYRTRSGNRSLDKRGSVREILKTLKAGNVVGILADLNATREEGVFVNFFGAPACTTAGIATLALRTGAVVLPGYVIWDETAQIHRLHFEQPIDTINTGNQKEDVIANTQRYTAALESVIRRHPDQWLWIHRRWRTRPEGEKEIY